VNSHSVAVGTTVGQRFVMGCVTYDIVPVRAQRFCLRKGVIEPLKVDGSQPWLSRAPIFLISPIAFAGCAGRLLANVASKTGLVPGDAALTRMESRITCD